MIFPVSSNTPVVLWDDLKSPSTLENRMNEPYIGQDCEVAASQPKLIEILDQLNNLDARCNDSYVGLCNVNDRLTGSRPREEVPVDPKDPSSGAINSIQRKIGDMSSALDKISSEISSLNGVV